LSELTRHYFVGIDWGSETHHVCLVNTDGQIMEDRKVHHSSNCLAEILQWLSAVLRDSATIAIEVPHGQYQIRR
jgi:hypothetical protein